MTASIARSSQANRSHPRTDTAVKIVAHTASTDIHLHGNCTKRSSGKNRQKTRVIGNIRTVAAAESAAMAEKCLAARLSSGLATKVFRQAVTAAHNAQKISSTAMFDAIRLKASCSLSVVFAYIKFSAGVSPSESTPEMLTQRCS